MNDKTKTAFIFLLSFFVVAAAFPVSADWVTSIARIIITDMEECHAVVQGHVVQN